MVLSLNNIWRQAYGKRNPIYHFYEEVPLNAAGLHGAAGDKHYKCFHGARKVLTITKAMRLYVTLTHGSGGSPLTVR
jgi:hypothetical protein